MPKLILPTPDLNASITRPIVYSIARDILHRTGLNPETSILYPDETEGVRQLGSAITPEDQNRFNQKSKIEIDAKETYHEGRLLSTPVMYPEHKSVFSASEIKTAIVPVYSYTELELSIRFHTRDKNIAIRWRDDIRTRFSQGRGEQTHEINYNYMIPPEFMERLKMLHTLREQQGGYNESFEDWFNAHVSPKATVVTDVAGANEAWVIAERQIEVLGWFDFNVPDELTRDDNPTGWTASFSYKVMYDKPIELFMCFPVCVHNQIIPKHYRNAVGLVDPKHRPKTYSLTTELLSKFKSETYRHDLPGQGVIIPSWDEFHTENTLKDTLNIFTALTTISAENPTNILNLHDLGDKSINGSILKFILESEASFILQQRQSIFNLCLYCDDSFADSSRLTLTTDGEMRSIKPLLLRECYHVRLSLYVDWSMLSKAAIDRARGYPAAIIELLRYMGYADSAINAGQYSNKDTILDVSEVSLDKPIPVKTMSAIVDHTRSDQLSNNRSRGFFTVGVFMIQANPANAPIDPRDNNPDEKTV